MPKRYRVFFYQGDDLGLKTRVSKGEAWIDDAGLNIKGPSGITVITRADVQKAETFRLHGMGRVIRIEHKGGRLYLAVIRFMIGQFASVNFFRTGELHKALSALVISN